MPLPASFQSQLASGVEVGTNGGPGASYRPPFLLQTLRVEHTLSIPWFVPPRTIINLPHFLFIGCLRGNLYFCCPKALVVVNN